MKRHAHHSSSFLLLASVTALLAGCAPLESDDDTSDEEDLGEAVSALNAYAQKALAFDGSDSVRTAGVVTTATNNVSLEAWVKWSGGGNTQFVAYNGNSGSSGFGIILRNNVVEILCGGVAFVSSTTTLSVGAWQHVAAVRENGTWKLYVDGVAQSLTSASATPNPAAGLMSIGSNLSGGENFNGAIDEVRVWGVARTAQQITDNYRVGLPGTTSGLLAYYRLDAGTGTTAANAVGASHTATLYGSPTWIDSDAALTSRLVSLTVSPPPVHSDITAFYPNGGPYANVSCQANKKYACQYTYPVGTALSLGQWGTTANYAIQSWTGACTGTTIPCLLTMNDDKVVSSTHWTTVLSATAPANGSISGSGLNCGATCSANATPNSTRSVTANPALGYVFGSWGGDCTGAGNPCSLTMSQNRAVSASFTHVGTKTLTAASPSPSAGGTIAGAGLNCGTGGSTCAATITTGQAVSFTANANLGYVFGSWGGACAGQGATCNLTMGSNQSVSVTFTAVPTYTLTISPKPTTRDITAFYQGGGYAGVSCQNPNKSACSASFNTGTVLELQTFGSGTFVSWGGDCAGAGSASKCVLTMNGNKTVSATVQ